MRAILILTTFTQATSPLLETDLTWHAPRSTSINSLNAALNATGVYGYIFNSSTSPAGVSYGSYNFCNMPHVRRQEYVRAPTGYKLKYVEIIHRHHKRTPYLSNTFPTEAYGWDCSDSNLFLYANPSKPNNSAQTYWEIMTDSNNPFDPGGFPGNCAFPQITKGGLDDSYQHGLDLYGVYHDLLGLIPDDTGHLPTHPSVDRAWKQKVVFRVTNNVITSQVAGMVISAMLGPETRFPLQIQKSNIDSLEPSYNCPRASALFNSYTINSSASNWTSHLKAAAPLLAHLDSISGISPMNKDWHMSIDHYFDTLSARLCHAKPLPCSTSNLTHSISEANANAIFRLGQYEYSFIYRDTPISLLASTASFGVYIAELRAHLTAASEERGSPIYWHNIAHDGSIARLLSILQVDVMVWPGMGAEVVFELYKRTLPGLENYWGDIRENEGYARGGTGSYNGWFVRILWGGKVMRSSSPELGIADMVPLGRLVAYFDGLVGVDAVLVPGLCMI